MPIKITPEIIYAVKEVEKLLIAKDYKSLTLNGRANRLSAEEVEKVITEYGGLVTERPLETMSEMEMIKIDGNYFNTYHLDYDLYFENKHSDLTLSLEVINNKGKVIASIVDLHVM